MMFPNPIGRVRACTALCLAVSLGGVDPAPFDHRYERYAELLDSHVRGAHVDYEGLQKDGQTLDEVAEEIAAVSTPEEQGWSRPARMAYWINAYNLFTLRAVVQRYPIRGSWLSRYPRNSIRQIDGVWTKLTWKAAGRDLTLDQIEHEILRPLFKDARIHFAINCASISCPPLAPQPYTPDRLDAQLDEAARRYLASPQGLRSERTRFSVSSIFNWYGDDFVPAYAPLVPGSRPARERAVLGVIVRHGPADAARTARAGLLPISFLSYDWSLNEAVARP